jgi:hypothetical protein
MRSMPGWSVCTISDIPDAPTAMDAGDPAWKPIQHHLGLTAFGINAYTARAAGDELASEHDEAGFGQQEVYVVMAGEVRFVVDGQEVRGGPGTVVAIRDAALRRSATAVTRSATMIAVGCRPGCFETSWDARHFRDLPRHPSVDG